MPFDTALIKGSTVLSEVVDASGIPASVFTQVYGVPEIRDGLRQLKDLKDEYGCSPGEVRAFIAAYSEDPAVGDTWEVGAFEESEEHELDGSTKQRRSARLSSGSATARSAGRRPRRDRRSDAPP